jgi:DNA/RNA-binding domain of Phe-tRNA-synthetase-like protein
MSHGVEVDPRIRALRPDFVVAVVRARGLENGPSDRRSTSLLRRAEEHGLRELDSRDPADHPSLAAWRDAYRAFGAKAQRTPCSAEALVRRVAGGEGIPAINRLVDLYNAVSVEFVIPVGGEDLSRIVGPSRLTRATGAEPFDTVRAGEPIVDRPEPGEVVWIDDAGVTCRRWNWRQCVRTRLTEASTEGFFVLERLEPFPLPRLTDAVEFFVANLRELCPRAVVESWMLGS